MILKYLSPETKKWVYYDRVLVTHSSDQFVIELVGKAIYIKGKGFIDKQGQCEWNKFFTAKFIDSNNPDGNPKETVYFYTIKKIVGVNSYESVKHSEFKNVPIRNVFSRELFEQKMTSVGRIYPISVLEVGDQKSVKSSGIMHPDFVIFYDKVYKDAFWFLLNDRGDTVERL